MSAFVYWLRFAGYWQYCTIWGIAYTEPKKWKKMVASGRGLGHVTYFSNFGTPNIYLWNGWRYKPQILHADWSWGLLVLRFGLDPIYSSGDIAIFIFCRFGSKLPIHAGFFLGGGGWGHISPKYVLTPKRTILVRKHVVWAIERENRLSGSTWRRNEKKSKDRTVKKVTRW